MGYKSSLVAIRQLDRHSVKRGRKKMDMCVSFSFSLGGFVSSSLDYLSPWTNQLEGCSLFKKWNRK